VSGSAEMSERIGESLWRTRTRSEPRLWGGRAESESLGRLPAIATRPDQWRPVVRGLVGRDAEVDRIRAFLAAARSNGGALLVTGEPGVGKTELLVAASEAASGTGTRVTRASGVEFEAGTSFSGLNQVLLPLLDALPQLPAVHRDALNLALGFADGAPLNRLVVSNAALVRPPDRCSWSSTTCPGWTGRARAC
jgi:hypothetical protein